MIVVGFETLLCLFFVNHFINVKGKRRIYYSWNHLSVQEIPAGCIYVILIFFFFFLLGGGGMNSKILKIEKLGIFYELDEKRMKYDVNCNFPGSDRW